jgi:hypothetical protein
MASNKVIITIALTGGMARKVQNPKRRPDASERCGPNSER